MKESRLRPRVVLWWGIGLTAGGLLLTLLVSQFGYSVVQTADGDVTVGMVATVDVVTRLFTQVIAPLGVALIGAGIVMAYVARLHEARPVREDRLVDE